MKNFFELIKEQDIVKIITDNIDKNLSEVRSTLKKKCGINYMNVSNNGENSLLIILKNHSYTFVYEYDKIKKKLISKGGRKNVDVTQNGRSLRS